MPNSPINVCDIRGSNESAELPTAPLATENVGSIVIRMCSHRETRLRLRGNDVAVRNRYILWMLSGIADLRIVGYS